MTAALEVIRGRRPSVVSGLMLAGSVLTIVLSGCASNKAIRSNEAMTYDGLETWSKDKKQQVIASDRLPLPANTTYRIGDCEAAGAAVAFKTSNPEAFERICASLEKALDKQFEKRALKAAASDSGSTADVVIHRRIVAVTKHNVALNVITKIAAVPVSNGGLSLELEAADANGEQQIALMVWGRNGNALTQSFIIPSFDSVVDARKLARRAAKDFAELLRPLPKKQR